MVDNPITRKEKYLAKLTGSYIGNIPDPITRVEKYLYDLCQKGISGLTPEEIENAVNKYLKENPVQPGATEEQAQQINQNKADVASLKEDLYVKTYNIFDVNFLPRAFIPLTGSHGGELFLDNNDNYSATNETINVLPNTQYTFSNGSESIPYELQLSVIFYDKDMRFLGYASNTINNSSKFFKFTTIENTNHLRFQLRSTGKGSDIPNIKKMAVKRG